MILRLCLVAAVSTKIKKATQRVAFFILTDSPRELNELARSASVQLAGRMPVCREGQESESGRAVSSNTNSSNHPIVTLSKFFGSLSKKTKCTKLDKVKFVCDKFS